MTDTPAGTPPGDATPDVMDELDKVASVVATARRVLAEGRMVDLSALEGRVAALCEGLRDVAPENREAAAQAVGRLLADLDGLEADIRTQFGDALADEPDSGAAVRRRATDAYGGPKPGGNGDKDNG